MKQKYIQTYKTRPKDYTAFELYQREHPGSYSQQLIGFVLMTFGVMGIFLGGIWYLQHLGSLIGVFLFLAAIYCFRRFK